MEEGSEGVRECRSIGLLKSHYTSKPVRLSVISTSPSLSLFQIGRAHV